MISMNMRKEIFIRRFIKFQSYRGISRDLNLNRQTVTSVSNSITKKINELGLNQQCNLIEYTDMIVTKPKYEGQRKKHKVNATTMRLIKSMVKNNEIKRTRGYGNIQTIASLYSEFKTLKRYDKEGNNMYRTDITYNHFYKLVTKIKKEFLEIRT